MPRPPPGSVGAHVSRVVAVLAIGAALEEAGSAPSAGACKQPLGSVGDCLDIVAVDRLGRDPVAPDVLRARPGSRCRSVPPWISAYWLSTPDDHQRELPQRRHVEGLVRRTVHQGAVADERDHHARAGPASSSTARRPRRSACWRPRSRSPRARRGETSVTCIEPPLPPQYPPSRRQQLREHALDRHALGDDVAVPAMRREDLVLCRSCRPTPVRDRLLPHRDVDESRGLGLAMQPQQAPPRTRVSDASSRTPRGIPGLVSIQCGTRPVTVRTITIQSYRSCQAVHR